MYRSPPLFPFAGLMPLGFSGVGLIRSLFFVSAFDTARHAGFSSGLECFESLNRVCESVGIFGAGVWASLKRAQPIRDDGEQCLLRHAVDAILGNGPILEADS